MSLKIKEDDITKLNIDCIVNAANETLLGGGGVDGAIHRAAGPKLLEECKKLNGCKTGEAKITKGYNLKAKYIIHTVGPIYVNGKHNEKELLKNCYINSLQLALNNKIQSIAFPLISAGVFGYPIEDAIKVAVDSIKTFLKEHNDCMEALLVLHGSRTCEIAKKIYSN